ncbi:MAG TPA: hypothetical protein VGD40_03805 [Chryseosolibacter sp.]
MLKELKDIKWWRSFAVWWVVFSVFYWFMWWIVRDDPQPIGKVLFTTFFMTFISNWLVTRSKLKKSDSNQPK